MPVNWNAVQPGQVEGLSSGEDDPPISTLVAAFEGQDVSAADVIVLRGYLGRSDIITRAADYLGRAKRDRIAEIQREALSKGLASYRAKEFAGFIEEDAAIPVVEQKGVDLGLDAPNAAELARTPAAVDVRGIDVLLTKLEGVRREVKRHLPWRLYLTPRLDRYVDFHRSSLLAWRKEAKSDRQDACTVWLRVFEQGGQVPIPYRLVNETALVPSFATWINGQLVDDYVDDGSSGAWGDQSVSGSHRTGPFCSNKTGRTCMA
jgi:hypothetical protein